MAQTEDFAVWCRQVPVSMFHLGHAESKFFPKRGTTGLVPPAVASGVRRVREQHPLLCEHSHRWEG